MPPVHDIAPRVFTQVIPYPLPFRFRQLVDRGWTQEIEWPYRKGPSLVFRLPGQRALVIGVWSTLCDEEAALEQALYSREVDLDDLAF